MAVKLEVVIPAPEGECEGGLCGPAGHRGWESLVPAPGEGAAGGEADVELRPKTGVRASLWRG